MTRLLTRHRTAGKWITIGSVFALSCTQPPAVGKGPQLDIRAQDIYADDWNTPLPEGVDANPDTFRANLQRYEAAQDPSYVRPSYVRLRAGRNCGGCVISVRITTLANTRRIDPAMPLRPGAPVAHLKNLDGSVVEAYFGLKPGSDADYFLWVDRRDDRPDSARITLLEVPHRLGTSVRAGRHKNLAICNYYIHGPHPSQGADFVEYRHPEGCLFPAPYKGYAKEGEISLLSGRIFSRVFARVAELLRPSGMISGGGWIDCNSGCCT